MDNEKEKKKLEELTSDKWKQFEHLEHQLGVLDNKALAIISLDGLILVLTLFLGTIAIARMSILLKLCLFLGPVLLLFSAGTCCGILRTKWALSIMAERNCVNDGFLDLLRLRDRKTGYLHLSICLLLAGLVIYSISIFLGIGLI